MTPNPEPWDHPSAWRAPQMAARSDWIVQLDDDDVAELEHALAAARRAGLGIPALSGADLDTPRVAAKLQGVRRMLEDGIGFALVRGLPRERYSKADAALIYWIVGTRLGDAFAQNAHGEVLGHVRDIGADWRADPRARGYQTRMRLPFHNDSTDVVGLMCLQKAKSGGESQIVSSTAIHNEFLRRRPDLWAVMHEPFCVDRRGEENPGQRPWYVTPCFTRFDGRLFVRYNRSYIESAQRFDEVPRLTPLQREALDLMDALCDDPAFRLDMAFEPGDMQFVCNYTVLHSRGEYEDWPEPERKRHLLRLWLRTPGFPRLPAAFADRNADMIGWQARPRAPVFDLSEIAAELAH
jgi:hypothetical protein